MARMKDEFMRQQEEISWDELHDLMLEDDIPKNLPVGMPDTVSCTCGTKSDIGEIDKKYHSDWCDLNLWDTGNVE